MSQSRFTILVVDDTPANLTLLADLLKERYKVKVAPNGEAALRVAFGPSKPDLILLDIMMPGLSGYGVCRRLKADPTTCDIPIMFQTALSGDEDELLGFELGAVDFISKPINPHRLMARIATHLELAQARKTLAVQNEELLEAAKLREDIDIILRHDLKTPLNAIVGVPQCLIDTCDFDASEEKLLRLIEEAGLKMLEMINQSLDLVKMEQGSYRFEPTIVDLVKICNNVINDLGNQALTARVTLQLQIDGRMTSKEDCLYATGEALLCYSLLANLCKNALEASAQDETISIDLSERNEKAVIRIRNSGEVPVEIRDQFFGKYVTAGKSGGTGLGTYSAQLIAHTQKGSIDLDCSEPGFTTVTVTLPGSI